MDREEVAVDVVEESTSEPMIMKLDLSNIPACASFAIEVIARLAYFGTPAPLNKRDRNKAAYQILDNIFKDIRDRLKTNIERYGKEYDDLGDSIQGFDTQADSAEQVGCSEPSDCQV